MNKIFYCHGCGHVLQNQMPDDIGFILKIDKTKDHLYCKRCYDMIFHNKAPQTFLKDEKYWELFLEIASKNKLYVLIIDIFNIEGSIIDKMIEILKGKDVLIVVNKRDILPKLVKDAKIYSSIKNQYKLKELKVLDYVVVSARKKYNIDLLLDKINYYRKDDVFLIGTANVGKSSLVNALINSITQDNKEYISTSYYAGTTLGLIKVPFDEGSDLIDTPGIINTTDITTRLSKKTLENIIPKSEIKVRTYQLNMGQTLFISGFLELDYEEGQKQGFSIYASNNIQIHRTKIDNAQDFRKKNLGKNIITYPTEKEMKELTFREENVVLKGKNVDLIISGLCWINFKNIQNEIVLKMVLPVNISYYIRAGVI